MYHRPKAGNTTNTHPTGKPGGATTKTSPPQHPDPSRPAGKGWQSAPKGQGFPGNGKGKGVTINVNYN